MDIVERLRRTELHHVWDDLEGKMVGKMFSANPDGPEAANEIERLRKDYALAWENHLLHEQIFVLTEAKIERLQEAVLEIVYQIGQCNNMAAMDIAAPIAAAYIQQKGK